MTWLAWMCVAWIAVCVLVTAPLGELLGRISDALPRPERDEDPLFVPEDWKGTE